MPKLSMIEAQAAAGKPVFARTSVSQPLSTPVVGREQLPNPGLQYDVHAFPVHAAVTTFVDEHARLQLHVWPGETVRSSGSGNHDDASQS